MSACSDFSFGWGETSTSGDPPTCDDPGERYYDGEPCSPCFGDPDREGETGGETGGELDLDWCTPLKTAQFVDDTMLCGGFVMPEAEHCTGDAVALYHLTDFNVLDSSITALVKYDFVDIDESDPNWSIASDTNHLPAWPGVVQHSDNFGGTDIAFLSRGCCHQHIHSFGTDSTGAWIPHHPDCQGGSGGMKETPMGWCSWGPLDDGGGCVFPCSGSEDCPDPASMFCDLNTPDPYGQAPGTCRFEATPSIPTPLDQVGQQP